MMLYAWFCILVQAPSCMHVKRNGNKGARASHISSSFSEASFLTDQKQASKYDNNS